MFNPFYCLFEYSAHDNYTLQINPHSGINPEHLGYFKFIGRVVGLAIFHRRFLDAFFIGAFYKMILKKKVALIDMEGVDAEFHRTLTWTMENDITDVIYSTFSVDDERFGEKVVVDLKEGGRDIEVTNENKKEYVEYVRPNILLIYQRATMLTVFQAHHRVAHPEACRGTVQRLHLWFQRADPT